MSLLTKIFGDYSSKEVKRVLPLQKRVLALEEEYSKLTDQVSAKMQNRIQEMGKFTFRSRKLPDPTPYISLGANRYLGGSPLSKSTLLGLDGIGAAIDDGLLNIEFRVLGFETVFFDNMGNAIPELSSGSHFSSRQKDMFRRLSHGKRFYISHVRAIGPDGIERRLPSSMEVIVN